MEFGSEIIRSRQNRTVVEVAKLTDRKARENSRRFRFDGIKLLEEAVKNQLPLELILLGESNAAGVLARMRERFGDSFFEQNGRILTLSDEVFEKISEEKSPEGVISVAKYIDKFQKNATIYNSADFFAMKNERIVLLESVRDPSNIGAIIRSAAAIGIDRLILSADCADIYHAKAVRASMGTLFNQSIDRVENLSSAVQGLCDSGRRVFAATLDERALELGGFALLPGDCVVIGNEGHGISKELAEAPQD